MQAQGGRMFSERRATRHACAKGVAQLLLTWVSCAAAAAATTVANDVIHLAADGDESLMAWCEIEFVAHKGLTCVMSRDSPVPSECLDPWCQSVCVPP